LTFGVIATFLTLASAGVLAWGLNKFEAIDTVEIAAVEKAPDGEASNWLLVGTDSREGIDENSPNAGVFIGGDPSELPAGKRTDTMLIARVDPAGQIINLVSIPRDLYVPIAGTGRLGRINTAFNTENGEQRLVDTIENYFGIDINHYAEVNFVGFQDIVDELGGVAIWFDRPMRDADSGLNVSSAGCQTLNGFEALAFARSRNLEFFEDGVWRRDPSADLGRTTRQQYFLRRVVDTAAVQVDFTSLGKINSLLSVGGSNLVIDRSIEPGDLLTLARTFGELGSDRIIGHSLPVADFRTSEGAAVLELQIDEAQPILNIFRGLTDSIAAPEASQTTTTLAPAVRAISVFNGSGIAGQAGITGDSLIQVGFEVVEVGNAAARADTVVRYPSDQAEGAALLISFLAADPVVEVDENVSSVVLITGGNFAGMAESQRPIMALAGSVLQPTTTVPSTTTTQVGVVPGAVPEGSACA